MSVRRASLLPLNRVQNGSLTTQNASFQLLQQRLQLLVEHLANNVRMIVCRVVLTGSRPGIQGAQSVYNLWPCRVARDCDKEIGSDKVADLAQGILQFGHHEACATCRSRRPAALRGDLRLGPAPRGQRARPAHHESSRHRCRETHPGFCAVL